jgi:site-specific recombinase XerD
VDETRFEERPPGPTTADGSVGALLADFDQHLEGRHGCAEGTRKNYQREAKKFLLRVFPTQSIDWRELTAGKVADYVGSRAKKLSIVSRQNPAIAIRSLLRFLAGRRVSSTLRHLAWEFSDFLPLSFGRLAPAC